MIFDTPILFGKSFYKRNKYCKEGKHLLSEYNKFVKSYFLVFLEVANFHIIIFKFESYGNSDSVLIRKNAKT